MGHVTILSEKQTFKARDAFEVKELRLELPTGKKLVHFVAQRVPVSVVFPLTKKYEIYLISQYRYLFKKRIIEAVSGRVDAGENFLTAAKRELSEEAGMHASRWEELSRVELAGSFFRGQVRLFLAQDLEFSKQKLEETEDIEVIKMSLDEAVQKVMDGEIETTATMIGILMLDNLKRKKRL